MDWQQVHGELTRIALKRAGMDWEEGRWLRLAVATGVHRRLGYGSFTEYLERLFGYSARLTHEKLRVAEALEQLPQLAQALRDGALTWSAARELTRVANAETEEVWLRAADGLTVRQVETLVSGHRPGDLPTDARDESAVRHILRFEVSGEVLATFREAMTQLRRDTGGSLDDDTALLLMARRVLASSSNAPQTTQGDENDGKASYQLVMTVCESCGQAAQVGGGEPVQVPQHVASMARCDAQMLPRAHVGAARQRATQTIPPAVRRAVLVRDRHSCKVPGCRHAAFVDVHHIQPRESGGNHDPENLLTLCGAHHRAVHRGAITIEGRISSGLRFLHADGTAYGGVVSARAVDVQARAFRALRALGFGEREVQQALRVAGTHVGRDGELEVLVRAGLALLSEHALAQAS